MSSPGVVTLLGIALLLAGAGIAFCVLQSSPARCVPHPAFWGTETIVAGGVAVSEPHYYPEETCKR